MTTGSGSYSKDELAYLNKLRKTDELIKENYTDEQYFTAADDLLYAGAAVILDISWVYHDLVSRIIAYPKKKKKHSQDPEKFKYLANGFLFAENPTEALRKLKLNRIFLLKPLGDFAQACGIYLRNLQTGNSDNVALRKELKIKDPLQDIALHLVQIKAFVDKYIKLRQAVIEKYSRAMSSNIELAKRQYKTAIQDIGGQYMFSAIATFNKYDVERGVFSTLLQSELTYSKKHIAKQEIGIAYDIPLQERKRHMTEDDVPSNLTVTFSTDEDQEEFFGSAEDTESKTFMDWQLENEEVDMIHGLMAELDPMGLYRFFHEDFTVDVATHWQLWERSDAKISDDSQALVKQ